MISPMEGEERLQFKEPPLLSAIFLMQSSDSILYSKVAITLNLS